MQDASTFRENVKTQFNLLLLVCELQIEIRVRYDEVTHPPVEPREWQLNVKAWIVLFPRLRKINLVDLFEDVVLFIACVQRMLKWCLVFLVRSDQPFQDIARLQERSIGEVVIGVELGYIFVQIINFNDTEQLQVARINIRVVWICAAHFE